MSEFFKNLIPTVHTLPAYNALYELKGKDRYNRDALVRISQREDGEIPDEIQVRGMGIDSVEINQSFADGDFFRPVVGMSCDITIVSRTYERLFPLLRADETQYRVEVYENFNDPAQRLMFRGFYRPDSYRQAWQRDKAMVSISAIAGLGLLRHIKFTPPPDSPGFNGIPNEGPVYGKHKMAYVLSYLFFLAGNRSNWIDAVQWEWVIGGVNIPFAEVPINVVEYYDKNCMDVLEHIMSIVDTQIVMVNGLLVVRLPEDYSEDYFRVYTYRGDHVSDTNTSLHIISVTSDVNITGGQVTSVVPYRRLLFTKSFNPISNLVYNGNFEKDDAGWSVSPETPHYVNFNVVGPPVRHMRIPFLNPQEIMTPDVYVRTNINRGLPNPDIEYMRFRVEFDARCAPRIEQNSIIIKVRIGNSIVSKVVAANEWATGGYTNLTFDFSAMQYVPEMYLGIYFPLSISINSTLCIRNVRLTPLTYDHLTNQRTPFSAQKVEEIIELNPDSIRDADYQTETFEKSQYIWASRAPGNNLRRRDGGVASPSNLKKERMKAFYGTTRTKLSATGILKKDVEINAMTLVQESNLDTTFVVSSMKYGIIRKTLVLDLQQYRNYLVHYLIPPTPNPLWILADGTWNDDGEWIDSEIWHDD